MINFAVVVLFAHVRGEGFYNILSLDSARYKGLITANFIQHMEKSAYEIALE